MKILQTSHLRGLLKRFSPPSLVGSVSVSFGRRKRTDGRTDGRAQLSGEKSQKPPLKRSEAFETDRPAAPLPLPDIYSDIDMLAWPIFRIRTAAAQSMQHWILGYVPRRRSAAQTFYGTGLSRA